jgi:hypothetical protein
MDSWHANLTADAQAIEIITLGEGIAYKKSTFDLERISCKWWTTAGHAYVALYDREEPDRPLIIVDTDSNGANLNNKILGLSDPIAIQTAWGTISSASTDAGSAADAAAVTTGIQAAPSIVAIVDAVGNKADPAYSGSGSRSLISILKGVFTGTDKITDLAGALGFSTDAVAPNATSDSSLISLVKRGVQTGLDIEGKLPALGQAAGTASLPVVLPSNQIAAIAPLASVGRTWNLDSATDSLEIGVMLPAGSNTIGKVGIEQTQFDVFGSPTSSNVDASIRGDLIRILNELSNTKAIGDLLVQDSSATPRFFVRREEVDQTIGTVAIVLTNLDGSAPVSAPVLPIVPAKVATENSLLESWYTAVAAGVGYAAGDSISNVRLIDGSTGSLKATLWYNITQSSTLATAPAIATLKGLNDEIQELLVAIESKLTNGEQKATVRSGNKGTSTPADVTSTPAGVNKEGLDVVILDGAGNQITTFGGDITTAAKGTTLAGSPTSTNVDANRQALDVDTELPAPIALADNIANPTTPIVGVAAMGWTGTVWERLQSVAGSLKVALQSTTNNIGNVRVTDLVNFLPTMDVPSRRGYQQLTDGTNSPAIKSASIPAAATDPALVVAVSPNSGLASEMTLNSILTQLQGDRSIASQLFIDSTSALYLKTLIYNQTTNAYESANLTLNGGAYAPVLPETALAQTDYDTTETVWEITTSAAGYSIGDIVSQFSVISQNPIAVVGVLWYNQSTAAAIAAPLAGHRRRVGAVAATEATLTNVNNKLSLGALDLPQSVGVANPRKSIVDLPASIPVVNTNLLTGNVGDWLDVRAFSHVSFEIAFSALSGGGAALAFERTNDPTSFGLPWVVEEEVSATAIADRTTTCTGGIASRRIFKAAIDTAYIKIRCTTPPTGGVTVKCTSAFTQQPCPKSAISLSPGSIITQGPIATFDLVGAIVASSTTPALAVTSGANLQFEVSVSAIGGTSPTLVVLVQELADGGWRSIYRFPTITAIGSYRSPALPNNCKAIRYIQTLGGTTPSFTRNVIRYSCDNTIAVAVGAKRLGGFSGGATNIIDLPVYGRLRRMTANNRTAGLLFLQIHDKATALVAGDVPLNGEVYPIAANSSLPFTAADLGEMGTAIADNPRIGLSSTFNTYTAAVIAANQASLFVEVI